MDAQRRKAQREKDNQFNRFYMRTSKMRDDSGVQSSTKKKTFQDMKSVYRGKALLTNQEFLEADRFHIQHILEVNNQRKELMEERVRQQHKNMELKKLLEEKQQDPTPFIKLNPEIQAENQFIWRTTFGREYNEEANHKMSRSRHVPYP